MENTKIKNREVISGAILNIKKVYPAVRNVNVSYRAMDNGTYQGQIEVRLLRRTFIATKRGRSIKSSLFYTTKAILKQMEKVLKYNSKHFYQKFETAS